MSAHDLFGSDSDKSEDEEKVEELPSTQAHMDELFADDSDVENEEDENNQQTENAIQEQSSSSSNEENEKSNDEYENDEENNDENNIQQRDDIESELNFNENHQKPTDEDEEEKVEEDVEYEKEEENLMEKALPTTQDLFGDEDLDVSSDEDNEDQQQMRQSEDNNIYDNRDIDDRPPTPEKDEALSVSIELPRCNMSLGKELYFIKLPNFLSVDTKPFDPSLYEDDVDDDEILDEEGRARLKLKVENTIRWRYSKDKEGNEVKESNCRFVRWSDGSLTMHLGNEVFDVFKMPIQGEQNHLFVQQGTGLRAQAVFKNKLSFRPQSTASQTHRKMTMSIADRMAKAQKVKFMPATECDPETQRTSMIKKEDERLRAQSRRESQQRRVREKNHLKGLSSNYLEGDDDEEDFDDSLAAIKNKYKKDVQGARSKPFHDIYSDDSEGENKLEKAKLDIESDDDEDEDDIDDLEIRRKRDELARKKKAHRKVIEESEDEDSD